MERRPACTIDWSWHIPSPPRPPPWIHGKVVHRRPPPLFAPLLLLHSETFSRHSIPRPYLPFSIDRFRVAFPFYAERLRGDRDRSGREKVDFEFCFLGGELTKFSEEKE